MSFALVCTPDYSEIFHVIVLISIVITVLDHFCRNRRSQALSYSDQQSRTRNNRTFVLTRALALVWHRSYSDTLGVQKESLAHESWWKIHHAWVNKANRNNSVSEPAKLNHHLWTWGPKEERTLCIFTPDGEERQGVVAPFCVRPTIGR